MNPLTTRHPGLERLFDALDGEGEETRIVGGAVRDWLIGRGVRSDIDLATTAAPREVVRRAGAAGLKAVPTGIEHGTVTVIAEGEPFEVTSLREDVETDGRRAKVRFGRDWAKDAARRDFTMNALYMRRDGEVVDLVGGKADAEAGHVRFIGDPDQRIREDYLRILRLFRFHAAYGRGALDEAALAAAVRNTAGLANLSRERIRAELVKLLVAPRAAETLREMDAAGLLEPVIGPVSAGEGDLAAFARLAAIEPALGFKPEAMRRLGVLAVRTPEDAAHLKSGLRLSNAEAQRLDDLAGPAATPGMCEKGQRAALYRFGRSKYEDRALIAFARSGAPLDDEGWRALIDQPNRWTPPVFPLNAGAFFARGLPPGPGLGAALRRAEELWIERGFPSEPRALVEIVRDAMSE